MNGTSISMTPIERTRRFWTAHGRSAAHLTILHAFCNNPTIEWTPAGLSLWYGLRVDEARHVVAELVACRIVQAVPGRGGSYRWDQAQDWAVPRDPAAKIILQERWIAETGAA